jgi:hypothetical protein
LARILLSSSCIQWPQLMVRSATTAFSGWYRWMCQVMLFNSCLNQTSSLSNLRFPLLTGNAVNTQHFHSRIILHESKKAGELPYQETHHLYIFFPSFN